MSTGTIVIKRRGRHWVAKCPKGLWEVSGPDYGFVQSEAVRYYVQYLEGGEYGEVQPGTYVLKTLTMPNPETPVKVRTTP